MANLRYAEYNGSSWELTIVDGAEDVGYEASLAFTPGCQPAISYSGFDGPASFLRYAERKLRTNP